MLHPGFFNTAGPFLAEDIARCVGAECASSKKGNFLITNVGPLSEAGPSELSFLDNKKYLPHLDLTQAGFILVHPAFLQRVPSHSQALITQTPYRSFALALAKFYPDAHRPQVTSFELPQQSIHPTSIIEDQVVIEPGAIIGPEASIGRGTRIASGSSIGFRVSIGRNCYIGSSVTISHSLIGDGVIIHPGVRLGQDGFGFAMSKEGHLKVPQIGRVIIQDDVEIGANTTIDRGAIKDTIIGQGTKIDNLVQIGHNVIIGRHCIIVAQSGISGSTELEDYVVMGGQSGVVGHVKIGQGAQVAGASHVKDNIPSNIAVCGTPARPLKQFAREIATLSRLSLAKKDIDTDNDI